MTDFLEDKLLNHVLRLTASATPATSPFLALFTANPGEAGGGTEVGPGGTLGYDRKSCVFAAPGTVTANTVHNSALITFGPNITTNWGTIVAVALFDAVTGGNMLFYCLGLSTAVVIGESVTVSINALSVLLQ